MGRGSTLQTAGTAGLRYALAGNLIWIGALKFETYERENIDPLLSSSPPFSALGEKIGKRRLAQIIGVTEVVLGSLIAAKPLAPRASAIGSLGAVGMFMSTLSFMATTPGSHRRATPHRSSHWSGSSWPRTACCSRRRS